MYYCPKCKKEVVVMGISMGAMSDEELEKIRKKLESEGKIILFNPPAFQTPRCPICHSRLEVT